MKPTGVETNPNAAGDEREPRQRRDQDGAAAAAVGRVAGGVQARELGRRGDREPDPHAADREPDLVARPEQRDQGAEDRADHPEVDAVHDEDGHERPVPREPADAAATDLGLVPLGVADRPPEQHGRDEACARVDVERARQTNHSPSGRRADRRR
jgi:hypothetical protein